MVFGGVEPPQKNVRGPRRKKNLVKENKEAAGRCMPPTQLMVDPASVMP